MNLKTYIKADRGRASELAAALGVSRSYLSQMAHGQAPISPERCVDIERETDREVTRQDLRPDDWTRIWPELHAAGDAPRRRKDDQCEAARVQADQGTGDS
jgi:DNA-binding transcriptional regulator YdaS (Cro superfamily)